MLREYDGVEPLILSGTSCRKVLCLTCGRVSTLPVGEDQEVSIKEVADAIVKAVGFEGNYFVRNSLCETFHLIGSHDLDDLVR
jgi:GDP-L-fucose synthase